MEQLTFTKFLNHIFGPAVTALLEKLGIHPLIRPTPSLTLLPCNCWS